MRILIATAETPFETGGAEGKVRGLRDALRRHGHDADLLTMPHVSGRAAHVLADMRYCQGFDASRVGQLTIDLVVGIKFPTYMVRHPRKRLWIAHQYRPAYELWGHPKTSFHVAPDAEATRAAIHAADRECFAAGAVLLAGSRTVAARIERYNGAHARLLYHPPPEAEGYVTAEAERYFYFPSRLTMLKRHALVLDALALTRQPVEARFSWTGMEHVLPSLREQAGRLGVADRVRWLGTLTPADKRATYARSLGVIFPPYDEDLGYVTLEAMLAAKPVITCSDSGGPMEFVRHRENGLVVEPSPQALADALDELWASPPLAKRLGHSGFEFVQSLGLSWDTVVETLLAQPATE
jgi:glycosyltransferase involved in cell wall biosynthesis